MKKRVSLDQIINHNNWLKKHGVHPEQIKKISKPKWEYDLGISEETKKYFRTNCCIPGNITSSPTASMDRAEACRGKYIIAPVCNKSGYQVISKDDIKSMGRKI